MKDLLILAFISVICSRTGVLAALIHSSSIDASGSQNKTDRPVFLPKQIEHPTEEDYAHLEDDYFEYESNDYSSYDIAVDGGITGDPKMTTNMPKATSTKNATAPSKFNLNSIFEFIEFILKPTITNENTIENANHKININDTLESSMDEYFTTEETSNASLLASTKPLLTTKPSAVQMLKNESLPWNLKENVCISKVTFQKDGKGQKEGEYYYVNVCKNKFDSEFCNTSIQAGHRSFEIRLTTFCCPNHHLDMNLDACIPTNHIEDLSSELSRNLIEFNYTISKNVASFNDTSSLQVTAKFYSELSELNDEMTLDIFNTNNNTKWTVFLWDNAKFNEYINTIFSYDEYSLQQKLDKLMSTLKNHFVKFHHITQAIVSNNLELESQAKKRLRLSTFNIENRSVEFVNCKELTRKNQYYKHVADNTDHNYRLLIHKLQENSLLTTSAKSIHQVITEKLLKSTNTNFKLFKKLYAHLSDALVRDLSSFSSPITLFIPYDNAFTKSLRQDQIDALVNDPKCANKVIANNIVYEEICPGQLLKYSADYSSNIQRANFISVSENSSNTILYFNGQIVNIGKSNVNSATNGMIYRLSSLKLTGVVDFLFDLVVAFRKKFSPSFVNALGPNWLEVIKNESANITLFMPFERQVPTTTVAEPNSNVVRLEAYIVANQSEIETETSVSPSTHTSSSGNQLEELSSPSPEITTSTPAPAVTTIDRVNIYDYMVRPSLSYYQFNDGDLLTSLSNKKYLINVYPLETTSIPEYLSFIPMRNFQRKTINCQTMESPGISACSSQLIIFKSERNVIPFLNINSLIDYISSTKELSYFNKLLDYCGDECKNIYKKLSEPLEDQEIIPAPTLPARKGFTVILPTNDYFTKGFNNFTKYSKNMTLFKRNIRSNIFFGTYCYNFMRSDTIIENLMNRKVQSRRVHSRITKANTYLSENGILAHKTDVF